jgi:hypothetical protein
MLGTSSRSLCAQKIICQVCYVVEMDVASSKKGVKNSMKNTSSTENAKKG